MRNVLSRGSILFLAPALLACLALAAYLRQAKAAGTPSVALAPIFAFDFAAVIPGGDLGGSKFAIVDGAAARDSIAVLLAPASKALDYCLVLRTTVSGLYLSSWRVPRNVAPAIAHDVAGNIVLLRRQQSAAEVLVYTAEGGYVESFSVAEPLSALVDSPVGVIGTWRGGLRPVLGDLGFSTRFFSESLPPSLTATLPGNRIAVLQMADARLHVIALNGSTERSVLLSAPEIVRSPSPPPPSGSAEGIVVKNAAYSLASSRDGVLYVALTSHPLSTGAVVLEVIPEGQVRRCLRFVLPRFVELKTPFNPEGHLFPGKLLISGDIAVWLDRAWARTAVYRLPS